MFNVRFYRSLSIARQLQYSIVLAVVLSLIATSSVLIYISYQFQLDNLLTIQDTITDAKALEIKDYIDDLQSNLRLLARIPGLATWDVESQNNVLEGIIRHNSAYENVAILNSDQQIIASISAYKTSFPDYLNLSTAFEHTFERGEHFIGPIEYDTQSQITYTIFAVPIRNMDDEIDGVLLAQTSLEYLDFVISQAELGTSGYVYIVDQQLRVISQKGQSLNAGVFETISDNLSLSNSIRIHSTEKEPVPYNGLHEIMVFGNATNISGVGWYIVSELPVKTIYMPIKNMLLVMGGGLASGILIAILVSIFLFRQVIAPLQYLTKIATQISSGDRNVVVDVSQDNELGILAKTLNTMIFRLNTTITHLEEDIVERKRIEANLSISEKKYRQLLNLTQGGIWVTNTVGDTTFVNPSMAKILGYDEDEMLGKPIYEFVQPEKKSDAKTLLQRRKKGITEQFEFELQHKNGAIVYVNVEAAPILGENGNYIGGIASLMDVSARKLAEQNRFQLTLEKERTQILENFITQASHEFRTPLSIINTSVYLFSKSDNPQVQQRHISKIKDRVNEISRLVDALVHLTQLEGIHEIDPISFDLNQLLEQVLMNEQVNLREKNLSSSLQLDMNCHIHGSEKYLYQAIDMIVSNAIRFSIEGGNIFLHSTCFNNEAVIEIKDTGIGIHPDDLPHIFERFFRTDKQGATRGMGLGLPIAKRIIELHRGRIEVESVLDQGTTLRIFLPLLSDDLEANSSLSAWRN